MKKLAFPLVVIVLLFWVFADKCQFDNLTKEFVAKQDSLNYVVDSLEVDINKRDSVIDELYTQSMELDYQLGHQKTKIVTVTKWIDSSKSKIDTYSEAELISSFNQRYPADITTNLLPVAQPVLISAAKDLVELDGAKQIIEVKDSIIVLTEGKVTLRDSIIVEYQGKENNYKDIIIIRDKQIEDWKGQYKQIQLQNKKLKIQNKFVKIGTGIVIGGLVYTLLAK
jgi:hypothetical protein